MVTNLEPTYYAAGSPAVVTRLTGLNFDELPAGCVGLYSDERNNPLKFRQSTDNSFLFRIEVESETQLTASPRSEVTHSYKGYLGGIVSSDRQRIYWVNNSRPI